MRSQQQRRLLIVDRQFVIVMLAFIIVAAAAFFNSAYAIRLHIEHLDNGAILIGPEKATSPLPQPHQHGPNEDAKSKNEYERVCPYKYEKTDVEATTKTLIVLTNDINSRLVNVSCALLTTLVNVHFHRLDPHLDNCQQLGEVCSSFLLSFCLL